MGRRQEIAVTLFVADINMEAARRAMNGERMRNVMCVITTPLKTSAFIFRSASRKQERDYSTVWIWDNSRTLKGLAVPHSLQPADLVGYNTVSVWLVALSMILFAKS